MGSSRFSIRSGCFFFCSLIIFLSSITPIHSLLDSIALSCGSSGNSTAQNGRVWVGDADYASSSSKLLGFTGKSTKSNVLHKATLIESVVPYRTARLSWQGFTYRFQLTPGQKFIRLHFNPVLYKGFKNSKAFFTVRAGSFTLLNDFNPFLYANDLGVKYFQKEFLLNVKPNETVSITFTPSLISTVSSGNFYAFINGIEIVSMPSGLYYTKDDDMGVPILGETHKLYIDNGTALETVLRLNVGGNSFSDSNLFRKWDDDTKYALQAGTILDNRIVTNLYAATYIAPMEIYQTGRSGGIETNNLAWKIPVDLGFRYLVRLHFCELQEKVMQNAEREFTIRINGQIVEHKVDIVKWSGGIGIAIYREYVVTVKGDVIHGKHNLIIDFHPMHGSSLKNINGVLNALELFKLSNLDNNLANTSPNHLHGLPLLTPKVQASFLFSTTTAVATVLTLILTVLNIIVFRLRKETETESDIKSAKSWSVEQLCRRFSVNEMQSATKNFSPGLLIGHGGFGRVYRGSIDNGGREVAIKRLKKGSRQGANEFWTEIQMLSLLHHVNVVSLIGYCDEGEEMVLVYEYMPRGTLADHLYKVDNQGNSNNNPCLSWEQRLRIAIGAAHGLCYLHSFQHKIIVHRDIKCSNILLDDNWVAKISDFGLSKMGPTNESFINSSIKLKGTFGYMDPMYTSNPMLTRKSDVYAFGVVLFELLSGRRAMELRLKKEERNLDSWARHCVAVGKIDQLIDDSLEGQILPASLKEFTGIAGKCLQIPPHERPSMPDIVKSLDVALTLQQNSTSVYEMEITIGSQSYPDSQTDKCLTHPVRIRTTTSGNTVNGNRRNTRGNTVSGYRGNTSGSNVSSNPRNTRWWQRFGVPFRRRRSLTEDFVRSNAPHSEDLHLQYGFNTIKAATNDFSHANKLGQGGFGPVYKGKLPSGQEIAVKRLSAHSRQGEQEFKNEVLLLAKLQHRNLVSLLGFCIEGMERLLIYEFVPNASLDNFIFDRAKRSSLDWDCCYKIILGVARGLLYLHEDSRIRIIHRDLKASNVLLDKEMNPKISDFGVARFDVAEGNTSRVMGTFGYMAPEYAMHGIFSVKSDIFSFGMILLEIITGKRNSSFGHEELRQDLLTYVWRNWQKGNFSNVIDPALGSNSSSMDDMKRCIHIGLLCVQQNAADRPTTASIVHMLSSSSPTLQVLSEPAFFMHGSTVSESS